jgi:hypothetical protein
MYRTAWQTYSLNNFFRLSSASAHHIERYDISAQINFLRLSSANASTTLSKICLVWSW